MKTTFLPLIALLFLFDSEAKTIPPRLTVPAKNPPVSFAGDEKRLPPASTTANCSRQSPDFAYYNDLTNYIPNTNTPTKVIEIAFNIFQKDNGSDNFQNLPLHKEALLKVLSWINANYAKGDPPSDPVPGVIEVPERKIQFSLGPPGKERIYFYKNTKLWNADCFNTTGYSAGNLQSAIFQADPTRKNYLNIAFTEGNAGNGSSGCSFFPDYGDAGDLFQVIYKAYSLFKQSGFSIKDLWVINIVMRHELAHNIDIGHTYDCAGSLLCDNIDYWDDIFGPFNASLNNCPTVPPNPPVPTCAHCQVPQGCWGPNASDPNDPTPATHGLVTNNIVGGNKDQSYASPKQLGQMHRALSLKTIKKYVSPLSYTPALPIVIKKNQSWDFDIRLYSDLVIVGGYSLDVKCKITMPAHSKILVKQGGTLRMHSGSEIVMYDNAQFVVEKGGTLWHENGIVSLNGANTVLEIKGKLDLQANSTFAFQPNGYAQGNGYIRFAAPTSALSNNITAGTGSQIILAGTGPSDKVLEVTQDSMYAGRMASGPLALFSITKGKVELGKDSRLDVGCPLTLKSVKVTSNSGGANNHRGVHLYGQAGVSINGCTFEYGKHGVYAVLKLGGVPLTIENSMFQLCGTGLYSSDKGVTLKSCQFNRSDIGWSAAAMGMPSAVLDSTFIQHTMAGISFAGSTDLVVTNSHISSNKRNGIEFSGPGTLAIKCGSVTSNGTLPTDAGILISGEATLNMSPTVSPAGGNVSAVNNKNTISSNGANSINLSGGFNDLRPFAGPGAKVLTGNVKNDCSDTLVATRNRWKATLTPPVKNVDYSLQTTPSCGSKSIDVKDASPGAAFCTSSDPIDVDTRFKMRDK